jgi:hypothetical protein
VAEGDPDGVHEAHEIALALLNPILDGAARGEWSPADRAWTG